MSKPKYHICKACHTQIPVSEWESHTEMEAAQIDMFPETLVAKPPKQKRRRTEVA